MIEKYKSRARGTAIAAAAQMLASRGGKVMYKEIGVHAEKIEVVPIGSESEYRLPMACQAMQEALRDML